MDIKQKQYAYSFNDEDYHGVFDSVEAAIDEASESDDGTEDQNVIYIGTCKFFTIQDFAPKIFGYLVDIAWDEAGESSQEWLDGVTSEQEDSLNAYVSNALMAWADEHNLQPRFYTVENVQKMSFKRKGNNND
jgi:hypothetical protein